MINYLQLLARDPDISFNDLVQSVTDTLYQAFEAGGLNSNLPQLREEVDIELDNDPGDWLVIKSKEALKESIRVMLDDLI